ncbi:uncharacterized protein LOC130779636 isoform X2 [Actinidia eriantha]|uniref:uncharacterized protein LOC130779636 isoform X2 n=1 Tax=Actinidia eriantha TaxID=165200 RepID=UPI00258A60A1|nr:uncharacterized protein LOC130779636 isoform X2 [Actinidia eriantha]XP_057494334.1 uncharacterized protein LOC130779636 isoform X2 [Actinidia eriantha]
MEMLEVSNLYQVVLRKWELLRFKKTVTSNGKVPSNTYMSVLEIESKTTRSKGQEADTSHEDGRDGVQSSGLESSKKTQRKELQGSVEELAARAASLAKVEAAKNITPPNSAYQFEVSWRGLAGDRTLQACLLKVTSPVALPQIFKNALSAPILIDIIRCIATFFTEEMDLAVIYVENLAKVSRFDMIITCLSSAERGGIWEEQPTVRTALKLVIDFGRLAQENECWPGRGCFKPLQRGDQTMVRKLNKK